MEELSSVSSLVGNVAQAKAAPTLAYVPRHHGHPVAMTGGGLTVALRRLLFVLVLYSERFRILYKRSGSVALGRGSAKSVAPLWLPLWLRAG